MVCPIVGQYNHSTNGGASAPASVPYPANIVAGDVLVLMMHNVNVFGSTPIPDLPLGWVNVGSGQAGNGSEVWSFRWCYKVADGTESGSLLTPPAVDFGNRIMMRVPANGTPYGGQIGAIAPFASIQPIPSVAVSSAPSLMVAVVGCTHGFGNPPTPTDGMCALVNVLGNADCAILALGAECFPAIGNTGTRNWADGGAGGSYGFWGSLMVPTVTATCAPAGRWVVGSVGR